MFIILSASGNGPAPITKPQLEQSDISLLSSPWHHSWQVISTLDHELLVSTCKYTESAPYLDRGKGIYGEKTKQVELQFIR
jgi:hypothetical protein